jgi:hypothetical protein
MLRLDCCPWCLQFSGEAAPQDDDPLWQGLERTFNALHPVQAPEGSFLDAGQFL